MGNAVVHFEVNVRDSKRAREFYTTLFDWTIDANNPIQYGMVTTGLATGIGGGIAEPAPGAPPGATFYVQVEDVKAYLDKAVRLGGKVVVPETVIPDMVAFGCSPTLRATSSGWSKGPRATRRKCASEPRRRSHGKSRPKQRPRRRTRR